MHKVRVGVLRGGAHNYDTSLKTGEVVVRHLPDHYLLEDIFISRDGTWLKDGREVTPHNAISNLDVVFNGLHGPIEDGSHVQHVLEVHKIPFTGTGSFASAITSHTFHVREILSRERIRPIPYRYVEIPSDGAGESLMALYKTFPPPVIVRPVGVSQGVLLAQDYDEFVDHLETAFKDADQIILEEYIPGAIASVGVVDGYRGQAIYSLPAISQAPLSREEKQELESLAKKAHEVLGMRHYSRIDFLVSPSRGIYVTQAIPLPSIHADSVFHKALESVGAPLSHFLDHVVQLALGRK